MPCANAHTLTGGGVNLLPRPAGLSGCVQTATTSWPSATHLSKTGTAAAGVPRNTKRIMGLAFKIVVGEDNRYALFSLARNAGRSKRLAALISRSRSWLRSVQ